MKNTIVLLVALLALQSDAAVRKLSTSHHFPDQLLLISRPLYKGVLTYALCDENTDRKKCEVVAEYNDFDDATATRKVSCQVTLNTENNKLAFYDLRAWNENKVILNQLETEKQYYDGDDIIKVTTISFANCAINHARIRVKHEKDSFEWARMYYAPYDDDNCDLFYEPIIGKIYRVRLDGSGNVVEGPTRTMPGISEIEFTAPIALDKGVFTVGLSEDRSAARFAIVKNDALNVLEDIPHRSNLKLAFSVSEGMISYCTFDFNSTVNNCTQYDRSGKPILNKSLSFARGSPDLYNLPEAGFLTVTRKNGGDESSASHVVTKINAKGFKASKSLELPGVSCKYTFHVYYRAIYKNEAGDYCMVVMCHPFTTMKIDREQRNHLNFAVSCFDDHDFEV